jgi:uncharacterized protein (TIGR00255 family)
MSLQSMTGFARATGQAGPAVATWEVRSVNGKSVELRLRLPPGMDRLEPKVRQAVTSRFGRGSIQCSLTLTRTVAQQPQPVVNEAFLKDIAALAKRLETQFGIAAPTADGLLSLRGVLDIPEAAETEDERAELDAALLTVLDEALVGLEAARRGEGAALLGVLALQLDEIEMLTRRAEADPSREPAAIRARLAEQVGLLLDAGPTLDEQRLHMEAALLATRADIREEIDRLKTHVAAARVLLTQGGAVGRKLDFLAQEFNRESNTLCSKSNAGAVTAIGLELKAVVDRFREQVQNLE